MYQLITCSSQRTAIKRGKPSAPFRWLYEKGYIVGHVLDYGCGKGDDVHFLKYQGYDIDREISGYDPYYKPIEWIVKGRRTLVYTTITCTYVLNTIRDSALIVDILKHIQSLLSPRGEAFITVRSDKRRLKGETRIGTFQGLVGLDLPIVRSVGGYKIYSLLKEDKIGKVVIETFPVKRKLDEGETNEC